MTYIPLEIVQAALGAKGYELVVDIPSELINGFYLPPGVHTHQQESTVRLTFQEKW